MPYSSASRALMFSSKYATTSPLLMTAKSTSPRMVSVRWALWWRMASMPRRASMSATVASGSMSPPGVFTGKRPMRDRSVRSSSGSISRTSSSFS